MFSRSVIGRPSLPTAKSSAELNELQPNTSAYVLVPPVCEVVFIGRPAFLRPNTTSGTEEFAEDSGS